MPPACCHRIPCHSACDSSPFSLVYVLLRGKQPKGTRIGLLVWLKALDGTLMSC